MVVAWATTFPIAALIGATTWWVGNAVGGAGGAVFVFVILLALSTWMYLRSRREHVSAANVTDDWDRPKDDRGGHGGGSTGSGGFGGTGGAPETRGASGGGATTGTGGAGGSHATNGSSPGPSGAPGGTAPTEAPHAATVAGRRPSESPRPTETTTR
jgi:hypothetical protein